MQVYHVTHMHRCFLITLVLAFLVSAQDKQRRIGAIEFYGLAGFDQREIRANLPSKEGDVLPQSSDATLAIIEKVKESVKQTTGKSPTHVGMVCCDNKGEGMIFIGLPGKNVKDITLRPAPRGSLRLPQHFLGLYDETMDALTNAVLNGARSDDSKGYPLSTDVVLRSRQLKARNLALRHGPLLRRVLITAKDPKHRIAAAQFLGYARQSSLQIAALVHASRDVDDVVRNNAVRALGVLAGTNSRVAEQIPAEGFIEMLNSGSWTDRNKAGFVLSGLTSSRNPKVQAQLRAKALDSLIEMARWRSPGHASSARVLLGRIAGIEEKRLQQLIAAGQVDEIIKALNVYLYRFWLVSFSPFSVEVPRQPAPPPPQPSDSKGRTM
ncbi:MAG: HEAT repeat domain-containing protein [Acidobacteriota bacterium]